MNIEKAKELTLEVINSFPKSKNGQHYLRSLSGEKIFFTIFSKKYGLQGEKVKYSSLDIKRRLQMIESFPYFLRNYSLSFIENKNHQKYFMLNTLFFTFIIIQTKKKQFELLSFYPQ